MSDDDQTPETIYVPVETRTNRWWTGAGAGLAIFGMGLGLGGNDSAAPVLVCLGGIFVGLGIVFGV